MSIEFVAETRLCISSGASLVQFLSWEFQNWLQDYSATYINTSQELSSIYICQPQCFVLRLPYLWYILLLSCYYTGCNRRNGPDFGRVFLMLYYTDITQNTYVHSWTVTVIMAREKCGLLVGPRTVPVSWQSYPCPPLSVESWNSSSAHARLYRNARSALLRHRWAVICHV